nr:MAG: RNA-dependent RNA polymerase [Botourmiaviridae sp.]
MVHARDSLIRGACLVTNKRFETFVDAMEKAYGVLLARPRFSSFGDMKKFCSGLLEGQSDHPWKDDFRRHRLSSTARWSISFSLFLFRKVIPNSEPQVSEYVERMSSPQLEADPVFVDNCRVMVRKLFPIGWDKGYRGRAETSTLPVKSCYEMNRAGGGARGLRVEERWQRSDFCSYVMNSVAPRTRGPSKVQAVLTGGKYRVVSIPPRVDNALRPFHQVLYDFVSSKSWCLRGDAKPNSFKSFHRNGEVFVSGDYESATDNLNSEVQLAILTEIVLRARSIPSGIARHALSTFNTELEYEGKTYVQRRGQLMGQLLSFPLLCLINYMTFKQAVPRDVPVRINGDDIIFRARPEEISRWEGMVGKSGLVLSPGKTMKDKRFFSLNSSLFQAHSSGVRVVPFVRSKALWGDKENDCEKISSLQSRFYSFAVGMGSRRKSHFDELFLRENGSTITACRRSLTRGMGMKVTEETLKSTGLWKRELYYLQDPVERPVPSFSFSQVKCNDLPKGWVKRSVWRDLGGGGLGFRVKYEADYVALCAKVFAVATADCAWENPVITDSEAREKWLRECDLGTKEWTLRGLVIPKVVRMMRLSRRALWQYVLDVERGSCPRRNWGIQQFKRGKGVWLPGTLECDKSDDMSNRLCGSFFGEPGVRGQCFSPPQSLMSGVRLVDTSSLGYMSYSLG